MEQKVIKVIPLNLSLLETLGQGKVNEALVLQQVDYWCTINKRNDDYYIDGAYWTFSSINMMLKRDFPLCFSYDTLKRVLTNLEEGNFLITKKHKNGKLYRVNYNKISFMVGAFCTNWLGQFALTGWGILHSPLGHFALTSNFSVGAFCTNFTF